MTTLFSPLHAGALRLSNRIAMAPLTRNRSPEGVPGDLGVAYYRQRASAGLLISEGTAISHQGQGYADVPGLYGSEQLDGWKRVTDAVHSAGGSIVCQLWHVGRVSHSSLQPGYAAPVSASALQAHTRTYVIDRASGRGGFEPTSMPRALDAAELPEVVHTFAAAARHAVQTAGFDGVEIHAANGYLLEQFLKSGANQRRDDYGGSIPTGPACCWRSHAPWPMPWAARAPASACRPSPRPTTSTSPIRSRCTPTWRASWPGWAWPMCM